MARTHPFNPHCGCDSCRADLKRLEPSKPKKGLSTAAKVGVGIALGFLFF